MDKQHPWWNPRRYLPPRKDRGAVAGAAPPPATSPATSPAAPPDIPPAASAEPPSAVPSPRRPGDTAGIPDWAERTRREAAAPAGTPGWVLEPWADLSRHWPGKGLIEESRRRRAAGQSHWSFDQGADGEAELADALRYLARPDRYGWRGWWMLHSVPVGTGHGDLDHLLIGPPGLIVINTKNHTARQRVTVTGDRTRVGGRDVDHIAQVRREARRAARLLRSAAGTLLDYRHAHPSGAWPPGWNLHASVNTVERVAADGEVPVRAVLCFAANRADVRDWPADVLVTTRTTLGGTLEAMTPVLDHATVHGVYEIATRSTTWTRKA